MASVTESTVYTDTSMEDHIRSPFQLNKTREPVKLVSLSQNIAPSTPQTVVNNDESLRESCSSLTSLDNSEPISPSSRSSSIGSNPFSLNIKKVSKSSVGSSPTSGSLTSSLLPTSLSGVTPTFSSSTSLGKINLKESEKITELQKEIHALEKEIEAKDAKLSSTLKSIKQFWSPELKKERGARKEETEKCVILKEKYQIASSEIEEYKNALADLESEFQSQEKTIQNLNEKLKTAHQQAQNEANAECDLLKEKIKKLEDELFVSNKTLDDLEYKYNSLEEEVEEKNKCISDLEIILVDHETKLSNYEEDQNELERLKNVINEQEIDYQLLKKDLDDLKTVNAELSQSKVDTDQINLLNEKITSLTEELEKQEKVYQLSVEDVERFRTSDAAKHKRIDELEDQLLNKEKDYDKLQNEIKNVKDQLDANELENKSLQEQLNSEKSSGNIIEQKDVEIRNLNTKYEKLDKYLSERENALELCRDELKDVKTANRDLRIENDTLENQLFETRSAVERLEKQKDRFSRPKEDVVLVAAHNELQGKYEEIKGKYEEAKNELQKLQDQIKEYTTLIDGKDENIKSLEEKLTKETTNKTDLEKEVEKLKTEKSTIAQELEKSKANKKLANDEAIITPVNKQSKKMWDEIAKKDERIEELERQLKEKTKQLSSLKKNQTTEREKQHQLVNESKKVEIEIQQLEEEKGKRDQRIIVLEDALRESVTIAVETEEILARHKEMYENAVNKANDVRNEYGRVELEKKIMNIKNAFLILSLSEKDALIASMEATRKRQMDELFNIKQQKLLDSISEKDNQIAHMELQSSKTKKQDIKQLKMEKEKFVDELKEQNNNRMTVISHGEKQTNLLITELHDAPPEQVYEAIRHLGKSIGELEFYIEEFLSFSNEQYKKALADLPIMPRKKFKSTESLKKLSKPELLKELKVVDNDSKQFRDFVLRLLDKLEGVS